MKTKTEKVKHLLRCFFAFVVHDWKALAIVGVLILSIVVWLSTRDGFTPHEIDSIIPVTVTDSNGKPLPTVGDKNEGATNEINP